MKKKWGKRIVSVLVTLMMVVAEIAPCYGGVAKAAEAETNLITNGDFSTDTTGWTLAVDSNGNASDNLASGSTTGRNGNGAYIVNNSDGTTGTDIGAYFTQKIPTLSAGTYTLVIYAMGNGYDYIKAVVEGEIVDSTETEHQAWTNQASDWSKLEYTFEITEEKKDFVIGLYMYTWKGGEWNYIDDISLTKKDEQTEGEGQITEPEKPEQTVYDELTNGDFETDGGSLTAWTTSGTTAGVTVFEAVPNKNKNTSVSCSFWTNSQTEVDASISQKISLKAGTYVVTAKVNGDSNAFPFSLVVRDGNTEKLRVTPVTSGWETWDDFKSDAFTLNSETDITLSFEGNVKAGAWCGIDDIRIITPAQYEKEQKESVLSELKTLYGECGNYNADDYNEETFQALTVAMSAANTVITKAANIDSVTLTELQTAYNSLASAKNGLAAKGVVLSSIKVEKIDNLPSDFIKGVDVSSYISEKQSGVKYYDFDGNVLDDQGFFNLLHKCGINYVRIRVWNNPYDSSGNGYGGGNNDIEKAKQIGQWASKAGMKVLIDYHFSDFWTDPGKQYVPKAWRDKTVDEKAELIKDFAYTNTKMLIDSGVDVGMVQVGNETNAFFCGESEWENICKMFSAGSAGVRQAGTETETDILVALHFADPTEESYGAYADNLIKYNVDYDVFATSYYEFFHGTVENMQDTMQTIATKTGKKVMVAETSWATTLEDGDGHDNQIRKGNNQTNTYEYSAGGQAKEVRDVMNAMANISNGNGIGVFYWEPAWIPVGYAYDSEGNLVDSVYKSNQQKWEKYGSGWASSYGGEYQVDAKRWWGGSAMDNQAMFDMAGHPLESLKVFKYVDTGTTVNKKQVSSVTVEDYAVEVDNDITLPKALVRYNTTEQKDVEVQWNAADLDNAKKKGVGTYVIRGTIPAASVENATADLSTKCYLTILSKNFMPEGVIKANSGSYWQFADGLYLSNNEENIRTEGRVIKFWNDPTDNTSKISGSATIKKTLSAGNYYIGTYIQGEKVDVVDSVTQEVTEKAKFILTVSLPGGETYQVDDKTVNGYNNWVNLQTGMITIPEDNTEVTITAEIENVADNGWGAWDDFYVYRVHTVKFMSGNQLVSTQYVVYGASAASPSCDIAGYEIAGYEGSLNKIEEDKVIQVQLRAVSSGSSSSSSSSSGGSSSGSSSSGSTSSQSTIVQILPDGTKVETAADGTVTSTKTIENEDGSVTEIKVVEKPDGTKVESVTQIAVDGSRTESIVEKAADGTVVKTIETVTKADGSAVEKVKESITNSAGNSVAQTTTTRTDADGNVTSVTEKSVIEKSSATTSTTVTVKKDGTGKITDAKAVIEKTVGNGKKATINSSVVNQIKEAAGTESVIITMVVKDKTDKTKYKVKVQSEYLVGGNELYIYKLDKKTNKYIMVNNQTYGVSAKGNVSVSMDEKATYQLVDRDTAGRINEEIKASIVPKKESASMKTGKRAFFVLDKKANEESIESIIYMSSKESVATVNKKGRIKAMGAGMVTIKAKATLKNGDTKIVKMKVKVK